jgi:hypothetical protein
VFVGGAGEYDRSSSRMVRLDTDSAADAIELGGLRVPSSITDSLELAQDELVKRESWEP